MNCAAADADLRHLCDLVRRRAGLALGPMKRAHVTSKLAPVAERFGFKSVKGLLAELEDEPEELARAATEALTVNETSFFRDPAVFTYLRHAVLPALIATRAVQRRLRIWCAAAATGQEPYSLAMLCDEAGLFDLGWKIDFFATDLSREAVHRMRDGLYTSFELERGLPLALRARYFEHDNGQWRVTGRLRRHLRVQCFNLLDNYGWLGALDLVLCRNVLFYFSADAKAETIGRLTRVIADGGCLVLGSNEAVDTSGTLLHAAGDVRGVFVKKAA